ncbi:hypothetical protein ABI57_24295 [Salmonella enterica subsp. enterica serovar Veneziana]|nr:hypothetical protein ABI57_24295 [Salmonella enterica subsp. enterica serovar Veneziana]
MLTGLMWEKLWQQMVRASLLGLLALGCVALFVEASSLLAVLLPLELYTMLQEILVQHQVPVVVVNLKGGDPSGGNPPKNDNWVTQIKHPAYLP